MNMKRGGMWLGVVATTTTAAYASESGPAEGEAASVIGEVIVTAQYRTENAQKVPIAMTALSAADLGQLVTSSADIGRLVPNVSVDAPLGFGMPRTSIRGIAQGDFNGNSTSTIMIYADDLPLNATVSQGIPIWDIGRVEVLRGPQGTLFGRNATGGAIRYISQQPADELDGYANVTYGRFNQVGFDGALGGPLTDFLRMRVAVTSSRREGDISNVTLENKQGGNDYKGIRGILEWDLNDSVSARLMAQHFRGDTDILAWKSTPGRVAGDAFGPLPDGSTVADLQARYGFQNFGEQSEYSVSESDVRPNEHIEHTPVILNVDWRTDVGTLTSVTGYLDVAQSLIVDNDATAAPILTEYDIHNDRQVSQELRWTSPTDLPFEWVGGVFYMKEDIDATLHFDATEWRGNMIWPDANTVLYKRGADQTLDTYAAFWQGNYDFTPKLNAVLGARYTSEEKEQTYMFRSQWDFATQFPRSTAQFPDFIKAVDSGQFGTLLSDSVPSITGKESWDSVSWRIGLNYQATDSLLVYGLVSRGFKGGSFKPTANGPGEVLNADGSVLTVDPEIVTDYEIGLKSDWLSDRLRLNGSIFYYDYRDYQTNQLEPLTATQVLSNLPEAELYGVELEAAFVPVDGLTFEFGLGYAQTEITASTDPSLIGNELPFAEDFNYNGSVRYDIDTAIGRISPEVRVKHRGQYFMNKENDTELGDYSLWDAVIGFESSSQRFYGSLWGKNLGDKVVPIVIDDSSEFFGSDIAYVNARRTYGITFGTRFE